MSNNILEIKKRNQTECGTSAVRRLRKQGLIPANLLEKGQSTSILCQASDFMHLYHAGLRYSSVIELKHKGEDSTQVLVKQVQRDPVTENIVHIDFHKIEQGQETVVSVPIEATGKSLGVKAGGILNQYVQNLKVRLLPEDIQETVQCDISHLEIEDSIKVHELTVPKSWKLLLRPDILVFKVSPSRVSAKAVEEETSEAPKEEAK